MKINRLTADDFLIYKQIRLESLLQDHNAFGSTYEYDSIQADDYWKNALNSYHIFAIFDGDKVIGCAGLDIDSMERFKHNSKLWGVYISKAYRGKGMASILIDAIIKYAREKNILQIYLSCMQANADAVEFYKRIGFEICGIMPKAVKIGDQYFDDCLMFKEI